MDAILALGMGWVYGWVGGWEGDVEPGAGYRTQEGRWYNTGSPHAHYDSRGDQNTPKFGGNSHYRYRYR